MIVILGGSGQLGSSLLAIAKLRNKTDIISLSSQDCDITKIDDIKKAIEQYKPSFIINCAAYTDVNSAESDKERCYAINSDGAKNIALLCAEFNIKLVHTSTTYVFDGEKEGLYLEQDKPNPQSVYGKSKYEGELNVIKEAKTVIILRTNFLYSHFELKKNIFITFYNLLKTKPEIKVVEDVFGSFCYAIDFVETIFDILPQIKENTKQIYHFANQGIVSPFEFASTIASLTNSKTNIIPILAQDYIQVAPRPKFSALDCSKIEKDFNIKVKPWKESLEKCIINKIELELLEKK